MNTKARHVGLRNGGRRSKRLRKWTALALAVCLVGLLSYLFRSSRTDSWLRAECTVTGSRVIRYDAADSWRDIVLFRGQFELRYEVSGRDYYTWVDAGWLDRDREFVEQKVASIPQNCAFVVRYNPRNPRQAIVSPQKDSRPP